MCHTPRGSSLKEAESLFQMLPVGADCVLVMTSTQSVQVISESQRLFILEVKWFICSCLFSRHMATPCTDKLDQ